MVQTQMSKKIAIIQSNYIPWKGYFDIINSVDEFVIYDDAQFTKNDWRNRNKIKTHEGLIWLTIPIKTSHKLTQKINEAETSSNLWIKKHWNSIAQHYSKAKYFNEYSDLFSNTYNNLETSKISVINTEFILLINNILGITTKITNTKDYNLLDGQTECLIDICKQANASEYISGPRAEKYIDNDLFYKSDLKLTWFDYSDYPEYNQLYEPFEHCVSIIDLIFNEGPNATKYMKTFGGKQ